MSRYNRTSETPAPVIERRPARVTGSRYKRIQSYRSVFIAEYEHPQPLRVLDGGVAVFVGYYVVDEFGEHIHPIESYFISPVLACAAADIFIDTPKKYEAKVSALLRYEKNLITEF